MSLMLEDEAERIVIAAAKLIKAGIREQKLNHILVMKI